MKPQKQAPEVQLLMDFAAMKRAQFEERRRCIRALKELYYGASIPEAIDALEGLE